MSLSNRTFILLTLLDNALSLGAVSVKNLDADDQGVDDELAAFLQTTHERVQAFLLRASQSGPEVK